MLNNIDVVQEIKDENLTLRKVNKDDATFLFKSLEEKIVNMYLSLGPLISMEHSRRLIKNYLKSWNEYSQFTYIVELKEDKLTKKIGCVSLWNISWLHKRAEIGIWLIPNYFNRGLGTKVLSLLINIGFNHLNLHRLEAHTAIENDKAIKLFKKCGFMEEGVLKDYIKLQGLFHDVNLFAVLKKIKKIRTYQDSL